MYLYNTHISNPSLWWRNPLKSVRKMQQSGQEEMRHINIDKRAFTRVVCHECFLKLHASLDE